MAQEEASVCHRRRVYECCFFPYFSIRINFSTFRRFFFLFRSSRPSLILVKVNGDLAVRKLFKWRWRKELILFLLRSSTSSILDKMVLNLITKNPIVSFNFKLSINFASPSKLTPFEFHCTKCSSMAELMSVCVISAFQKLIIQISAFASTFIFLRAIIFRFFSKWSDDDNFRVCC